MFDDTDTVHVVRKWKSYVSNLQTYGGLRLQGSKTASLVVKLEGAAGILAGGVPLEIDDRIGGTVQIVGVHGFPVVLTSLYDDSVGAGFDQEGFPVLDTNNDGIGKTDVRNNTTPAVLVPDGLDDTTGAKIARPGDWRSVKLEQYSNDRNVRFVNESEFPSTAGQETNSTPTIAELLGTWLRTSRLLAISLSRGRLMLQGKTATKRGDNRPVGFEVLGQISPSLRQMWMFTASRSNAGTGGWISDQRPAIWTSILELVIVYWPSDLASDNGVLSGLALDAEDVSLGGYYTQNHFDEGMRR